MTDGWRARVDSPRRLAWAAGLFAFVVLALTAPAMTVVWDEGEYLSRSARVAEWLRLVADVRDPHGGWNAFADGVIREHFNFVIADEGHPGWGAVPTALSSLLLGSVLHTLTATRLGAIAVFSGACAAVAYRMRSVYGPAAAIVGVVSLLTFPRLFAEAHLATLDAQLTAWWLMLWVSESAAHGGSRVALRSGLLAGLTAATKFPGWLAWPPVLIARLIRGNRAWRHLLILGAAGVAIFFAVNPPLWHHPLERAVRHVTLNMHRELNVPIAFFGTQFDLHRSLPWYNTILWLLIVTPVPLLVLGAVGLLRAITGRDRFAMGVVLHWCVLMIARALPGTPPHDGIRLFLPSFGFWCVLAGIGGHWLWEATTAASIQKQRVWRGLLAASLAAGALNVARYHPQTLSHYNMLVGGVRGAARLGMEPTYWWDSLDRDVLTWLNTHTAPGERVAFSSIANISMIRGWGWLTPEQAYRQGTFKWYVFQNRTSFLAPSDRWLMAHQQPAFARYPGGRDAGNVPPDLDVPILLVYSFDQYRAAIAATTPPQ
jgi:hypothetical protein